MLFQNTYGVDLGTSTIKIYSQNRNKSFIEKNMVAVRDKERVIAVGNEAYEMFEKAPASIQVASPMAFGMIADLASAEASLYSMLHQIDWKIRFGSILYFAVPADITQIEKRAYYAVANGGRLQNNRVFIVEKPVADAIALGIAPESPKGNMIINIGAQSTEMSILADDRVIISRMVPLGGRQINEAICGEIRRRYHLHIGTRTARRLKVAMGRMTDTDGKEARKVVGIDSLTGLPKEEVVYANVVNDGIMNCLNAIGEEIRKFLERTPPQIAYHIAKTGIHLTGGSTRLPGIEKHLAAVCGYSFNLSGLYDSCTITGLEKIIKSKDLQKWAKPLKQRKIKDRNGF